MRLATLFIFCIPSVSGFGLLILKKQIYPILTFGRPYLFLFLYLAPSLFTYLKECKVYLVDDYSTDGTFEHLKIKYASEPKIKISQNHTNLGMCGNWNILMANANGEYWLKLDADDIIKPHFIEVCLTNALKFEADFSGSSYQFFDVKKNETSDVLTHQNRTTGIIKTIWTYGTTV